MRELRSQIRIGMKKKSGNILGGGLSVKNLFYIKIYIWIIKRAKYQVEYKILHENEHRILYMIYVCLIILIFEDI